MVIPTIKAEPPSVSLGADMSDPSPSDPRELGCQCSKELELQVGFMLQSSRMGCYRILFLGGQFLLRLWERFHVWAILWASVIVFSLKQGAIRRPCLGRKHLQWLQHGEAFWPLRVRSR